MTNPNLNAALCYVQASLFEKPVNLEAAKASHSEFRCVSMSAPGQVSPDNCIVLSHCPILLSS